jgi:hypothetical protein
LVNPRETLLRSCAGVSAELGEEPVERGIMLVHKRLERLKL